MEFLKHPSIWTEQRGVLLHVAPKPVMMAGATDDVLGHTVVNGVFEPTGELSGGWPLYRKRGDGDKWIHFWPETKQWIVTDTSSKGKDSDGWAVIKHEGSLESCAGRPWSMFMHDFPVYVEQPDVMIHLGFEAAFHVEINVQ